MSLDITLCNDITCPVKLKCHRFKKGIKKFKPGKLVSYFAESPGAYNHGKWECEMFWGDAAELLFQQLTDIMKGKHDN